MKIFSTTYPEDSIEAVSDQNRVLLTITCECGVGQDLADIFLHPNASKALRKQLRLAEKNAKA